MKTALGVLVALALVGCETASPKEGPAGAPVMAAAEWDAAAVAAADAAAVARVEGEPGPAETDRTGEPGAPRVPAQPRVPPQPKAPAQPKQPAKPRELPAKPQPPKQPVAANVDVRACTGDGDCVIYCPRVAGCCGFPCGCKNAINKAHRQAFTQQYAASCSRRPNCPAVACRRDDAFAARCERGRCVPMSGLGGP